MPERSVVLLVENEPDVSREIGRWLEEAGHDVLLCPGPTGPDYTCVATRGRSCPLSTSADVVVLDATLAGEEVDQGASSLELLLHYWSDGKPVVLMCEPGSAPALVTWDPDVTVVATPAGREAVVAAVRERLSARGTGSADGSP